MQTVLREVEGALVPVRVRDPADIWYGSRTTSFFYQVLDHDPVTGRDSLHGYLDGVASSSSAWQTFNLVKGSASVDVRDLAHPQAGQMGFGEVDWFNQRLRIFRHIDGIHALGEGAPLGTFLTLESPHDFTATSHMIHLGLHEKTGVLDQDAFQGAFVADDSMPILQWVKYVIESAGESCDIDMGVTDTLAGPRAWTGGEDTPSKLTICNDLLDVIGYEHLVTDGWGRFLIRPYVPPAQRPVIYDVIGLPRELLDGPNSIYESALTWDRDFYQIPNVVVAWGQSRPAGDDEGTDAGPLFAVAMNMDPASPFSIPSRHGRTLVQTLTGVEVPDGTEDEQLAALGDRAQRTLIGVSSPPSVIQLKCLWMPIMIGDVVRFANTPAGIDGRFVVTSVDDEHSFDGRMALNLQEVVSI